MYFNSSLVCFFNFNSSVANKLNVIVCIKETTTNRLSIPNY